mgnify:CR=1 FL=1
MANTPPLKGGNTLNYFIAKQGSFLIFQIKKNQKLPDLTMYP